MQGQHYALFTRAFCLLLIVAIATASFIDSPRVPKFKTFRRSRSRTEIEVLKEKVPVAQPSFNYMLRQPIVSFAPIYSEHYRLRGKIRKMSNRFSMLGF
ncbi:hypothetical protein QR680_010124 [Steinernema hermaphroditum]|uniref:Uncharacterized protein n=1 Tax=Steinernema hermaphroditum TaxID=289476 RepID=A0AA39IPR1_9BILA|nr:hypothetical protein QR680_010124 [Steinernema hermaphroditum]